jgi:hypothetical protein
VLSRAH